jgi:type I restriction enzyme R subunit
MTQISELHGVEMPIFDWLSLLGWTPRPDEDLKQYKRPISNPVIDTILSEKIQSINSITAADAKKVMDILYAPFNNPNSLTANELFLELITKGVNVKIDQDDKTIRIIDFEDIWNNSFIVTRQYWVQGSDLVKPDVVLLINGIPLICIEAKQRAKQNSNYFEGIKQLGRYDSKASKLYTCNLFGVAANGKFSKYGTLGSSASFFFEWKDLSVHNPENNPVIKNNTFSTIQNPDTGLLDLDIPEYEQMKQSLCGLLQPERVLDILQNFIVFERSPEAGIVKKVARYQQFRAANKIVYRVIGKAMKHGVIWHTQGSGKSLTILFTAYKLRNNPILKDPTVYIVVDRKDLKDQIGDTFEECDFPNTFKPTNIGQLKQKITAQSGEVIISTIQKFQDLGDLKDERENVFVLIDEAHRTQYGDFHSELKAVLPEASRFAFTGTPIPKTIREFGKISTNEFEKYLDRYSIKDSIDDGATVEIIYTFGPTDLQLDKENLKKGWDELSKELSKEEKQAVQKRVQPWKTIIKKPERIALVAKDIAEDYRTKVEPDGFKAQVVAVDKEACVTYYNELLKNGFDTSEIQIVFSKMHNEPEDRYNLFKDHYLNDGDLKKIVKKFKKRITPEEIKNGNNLKILIVCNMLLTGFDAPIEQAMYLDSPFKDHTLLQAIARTNRPYDDKPTGVSKQCGRIVDYLGIFKDLNNALNYDPADIGTFKDEAELFLQFPELLDKAMQPFESIKLEDTYQCTIEIVRILNTIDRNEFEKDFRKVVQLYEAISPSALLIPYFAKYQWLLTIYQIYLSEFKRLDFDAEFYAAKTRKLLQESTKVLDFRGHLPEVKIDSNYIDKINNTKLSPDDKAEKIIRDIETVVRKNELQNPVYIDYLKRLEALTKQKREKAKSIEDILNDLETLFNEVEQAESLPQRMGFEDLGEFTIFQEIKNLKGDLLPEDEAKALAFEIGKSIKGKRYTGWQESDQERRNTMAEIAYLLCDDKYEQLDLCGNAELAEKLLNRLIQHYAL